MTGRGIDQVLPYPSNPQIHEPAVADAREYVALAEKVSGKINYPVSFDYVCSEALPELTEAKSDLKIFNLETTITTSENYLPKGINYRMSPQNIKVLKVLGVDVCVLANNHILDWGWEGLIETVTVLEENNIRTAGAGRNPITAKRPVIFDVGKERAIIFAYAHASSGVPPSWQARASSPVGVNLLTNLSEQEITEIRREIAVVKRPGDLVIFSVHWGPNWGYEIDQVFIDFAHRLVDVAHVDLVFGHSSHHFKGLEIYKGKLILYGAGDFINDYEGIAGYEEYRGDLSLMYFPEVDWPTKNLVSLTVVPLKIKKFRLNLAREEDLDWSLEVLRRESRYEGKLVKTGNRLIWQSKI